LVGQLADRFPLFRDALARLGLEPLLSRRQGSADTASYADRLEGLTQALRVSGQRTAALLSEMEAVAADRLDAVSRLEQQLQDLEGREREASARLQRLEQADPKVAQDFARAVAELTAPGEARSRRRDYALFTAGSVVSLILSLVFLWLGG
jgi:hypothetical protein